VPAPAARLVVREAPGPQRSLPGTAALVEPRGAPAHESMARMTPTPVTDQMLATFHDGNPEAVKRLFVGADDLPNVEPCEGVVHRSSDGDTAVVRIPLALEPDDLRKLLAGGQVWVSMWGGVAPFAVEVVPHPDDDGATPSAQKALHHREQEALDSEGGSLQVFTDSREAEAVVELDAIRRKVLKDRG